MTWSATTTLFGGTNDGNLPIHGKTVLELVRDNIGRCEMFLEKEEEKVLVFKERVVFGSEVLDAYEPGSYQRFCAEQQLAAQNKVRKSHNKSNVKTDNEKDVIALQKKTVAVEGLLESLRATEKTLVDAGAKTYHELFPEKHELALKQQEVDRLARLKLPQWNFLPAPFTPAVVEDIDHIFVVSNLFNAPYLGEGDIQGAYLRLFEAIWRGTPEDASLVKELALGPTGEGKSKLPALRISVADSQGYTTLWLALYRRNWDMARLILAIVDEQYEPPNGTNKEKRYVLESREIEDFDSQMSDDEIQMDVVTTEFTVENIGIKRDLVKCNVSPYVRVPGASFPSAVANSQRIGVSGDEDASKCVTRE